MARDFDTIGVIIGDGAPLLELSVPPRVFGIDQSGRGGPRFDVVTATERADGITSTAGIRVQAPHPMTAIGAAGVVIVPGWREPGGPPPAPEVVAAVRTAYDDGATVVGLCLGAFVLAAAGVLDGRRATTHWRHTAELARAHPAVDVVDDVLFVDEGRVVTSAGSAAGIDTCLHLLRREHGSAAANAVARALVVAPQRSGGQAQFVEHPVPAPRDGGDVAAALAAALDRLGDEALAVDDLAATVHMSRRTFDRRFRAATGCSPLQWLVTQRLLRAQQLLEDSDLPVDAVARRSGFHDAVAMRPHFRRFVGVSPHAYRNTFRGEPDRPGAC